MKKMTIHRRLLLFLLAAGFFAFICFSFASVLGLFFAQKEAVKSGRDMGETVGSFVEDMTKTISQKNLLIIAQNKAHLIDDELFTIKDNTENIAFMMERILEHPEYRKPRKIKEIEATGIKEGEACIYFAPNARSEKAQTALAKEISIASAISDTLENTASFYLGDKGFFSVASEKGYYITVNTSHGDDTEVTFTEKFLTSYVPKDSEWYKQTAESKKLTVTHLLQDENAHIPFVTVTCPYFVKEQLAGVANISLNVLSIREILEEQHALEPTDFDFVLDDKGEIVIASKDQQDIQLMLQTNFLETIKKMTKGEKGVDLINIDGTPYYLAYSPISSLQWSLGSLVRADQYLNAAKIARYETDWQTGEFTVSINALFQKNLRDIFLMLLTILITLVLFSAFSAKRFVAPILATTKGVREIAKGNLDKKLNIRTGDEFEELANSVNHMTSDLKEYIANLSKITKDKERISTELNLAKDIQMGFLPDLASVTSVNDAFDLYATMEAAKSVGGDFYDFYALDKERVVITIADVSGKGVPAALFMAISKTIIKNSMTEGNFPNLAETIIHINDTLAQDNTNNMFLTAFIGVLNLKTGNFKYVNAGHNPPLWYKAEKNKFEYLKIKKNFVLAAMEDLEFKSEEITLSSNDTLFLYTDGVTEALNEKAELYGEERLKDALNNIANKKASTEEILEKVRKSVQIFVGEAEQSDDITMIGIRYLGCKDSAY